jgi:hypothetical protein
MYSEQATKAFVPGCIEIIHQSELSQVVTTTEEKGWWWGLGWGQA